LILRLWIRFYLWSNKNYFLSFYVSNINRSKASNYY
jgi:hypothetical protein